MTQIKLPRRDAYVLNGYGARVNGTTPNDPTAKLVTLPPGWTANGGSHGIPNTVSDQHGRPRLRVDRDGATASVTVLTPASHATAVAESGAQLVIDAWATPDSMIGVAAERVATHHNLIERTDLDIAQWEDEQPAHTENLYAERRSYQQKLADWTALYKRLSQILLSGWTVRRETTR